LALLGFPNFFNFPAQKIAANEIMATADYASKQQLVAMTA